MLMFYKLHRPNRRPLTLLGNNSYRSFDYHVLSLYSCWILLQYKFVMEGFITLYNVQLYSIPFHEPGAAERKKYWGG